MGMKKAPTKIDVSSKEEGLAIARKISAQANISNKRTTI
jgi:hypothetical protein